MEASEPLNGTSTTQDDKRDPLNGTSTIQDDKGADQKEPLSNGDSAVMPANGEVKTDPECPGDGSRQRLRIPKTVSLYLCFLAAGFATNILGPTITNMRYFLNTDMESIVMAFSGAVIGWLGGSVLAGVFYERFNPELQLTLASMGIFALTAAAPWTGSLIGFIVLMTLQGLGSGYIDAGGTPYGLRLWAGSKAKDPVMQATAVFTSIGSSVGPLIVSPFLINVEHLENQANNNMTTGNTTDSFHYSAVENSSDCTSCNFSTSVNTTVPTPFNREDMLVGYAYVTLSIAGFIAMCFMFIMYLLDGPTCKAKASAKAVAKEEADLPTDRYFQWTIYIMLYVFFVMLMWIIGLGHLLPALVTDGLKWDVKLGSLIATAFWGMLGIGRVVGVFLSTVMSPVQMLLMDMSLAVAALGLMSSITFTSEKVMWFGAALAGFATASEFVSAVLWASKYVKFTGAVAAICIVGMGTGGIAGVQVAGYLFDKEMYMAMIYCSLAATIAHLLLFICMYFFADYYFKHLKKKLPQEACKKDAKEIEPLATEMKEIGNNTEKV